MKSKLLNIRLRYGDLERLEKVSARYNMSPGEFTKKVILALCTDRLQEGDNSLKAIAEVLARQSAEMELFQELFIDTTARIKSAVTGQGDILKPQVRGAKKSRKQKQT